MNSPIYYNLSYWIREFVKYFKTSLENDIVIYMKLLNIDALDYVAAMLSIIDNMPSDYLKYKDNLYINEIVDKLIYISDSTYPIRIDRNDELVLINVMLCKTKFNNRDDEDAFVDKLNAYFTEFRDNCNNDLSKRKYGHKRANCEKRLNTIMCKKIECFKLCEFIYIRTKNKDKYKNFYKSLINETDIDKVNCLIKDLREEKKDIENTIYMVNQTLKVEEVLEKQIKHINKILNIVNIDEEEKLYNYINELKQKLIDKSDLLNKEELKKQGKKSVTD